jgi:hypothetical protein
MLKILQEIFLLLLLSTFRSFILHKILGETIQERVFPSNLITVLSATLHLGIYQSNIRNEIFSLLTNFDIPDESEIMDNKRKKKTNNGERREKVRSNTKIILQIHCVGIVCVYNNEPYLFDGVSLKFLL